MGVAADNFSTQAVDHVGHGEEPLFPGDLGMENNLVENVAQLFFEIFHVAFPNGLGHFGGLFPKMFEEGFVGLFSVPGATVSRAEFRLHTKEVCEIFTGHDITS